MKRFPAFFLSAALLLSPALAVDAEERFPTVKEYPGYADVKENDWFYDNAKLCYELGLMNGTGAGFEPNKVLSQAEAVTLAARVGAALRGEPIPTAQPGEAWWVPYNSYVFSQGGINSPDEYAGRWQFLSMLYDFVEPLLAPINDVKELPDPDFRNDVMALKYYNAGILTGVDKYGTFNPSATLTRADCATMLARVIQPDLRKRFTPAVQAPLTYTEELAQTMALQVNGKTITVSEYMSYLNRTLDNLAYSLQLQGRTLDWSLYGSETLVEQYKSAAMDSAVAYCLAQSKASALGCTVAQLPEKLTPDPGREVLQSYAQSTDKLAAKHILVTDEALANSIVESLNAKPTQEQFDNLLALYGTDPGMKQSPQGYLFTAGDMVSEFEAGTRALEVGSYSKTPVKSQFGYHIIWRLDPVSLPDLLEEYRQRVFSQQLQSWVLGASVTVNEKTLELLDSDTIWASYLAYRETLSK